MFSVTEWINSHKSRHTRQQNTKLTTRYTQHITHNTLHTTHSTQHVTHNTKHTLQITQHLTHSIKHTTNHTTQNTQHATQHKTLHITQNTLHITHNTKRTSQSTQHITQNTRQTHRPTYTRQHYKLGDMKIRPLVSSYSPFPFGANFETIASHQFLFPWSTQAGLFV